MAVANPAAAYVVGITTSISATSVADDTDLEAALASAIDDVLRHAIDDAHCTRPIESDTDRRMRVSLAEYLRLDLRAHDLLRDVPLYDVSVVDPPGGGAGRSVADILALESAAAPNRVANAIYGVRHFLGRAFGWDRVAWTRSGDPSDRWRETRLSPHWKCRPRGALLGPRVSAEMHGYRAECLLPRSTGGT